MTSDSPLTIHRQRSNVLSAEPSWLDESRAGFGAPDFLWERLMDRYTPAQLDWVLRRPTALRLALVVTWRHWRLGWIEGEWRA